MKNIALILITFFLFSEVSAQRNFWSETRGAFNSIEEFSIHNTSPEQIAAIKENSVQSKTTTHYSKKYKNQFREIFDEDGYLIQKEYLNSKLETVTTLSYNDDHKITQITTVNNKGQKWVSNLKYENGLFLERENIDDKGIYSGIKKEYTQSGLVSRHLRYKKSRTEPTHELLYTYYEDGSKKSIVYNEKGKFKYEWNYDCKDEGELVNIKSKDKSTICIKKETDASGNTIIWNRDFNEEGKLIKTKEVRDPKDKFISKEVYNQEDRLLSKTYLKEEGGTIYESYDKNGNIYSKRESEVNKTGKLIKSSYQSKRYNYTNMYSYEGDLQSMQSRISKHGIYVDMFQYTYH